MTNNISYVNDYSYDFPTVTESFANKLKAQKANAPKLDGTPAQISSAIREAMTKSANSIITASPSTVYSAVEAELSHSKKCA